MESRWYVVDNRPIHALVGEPSAAARRGRRWKDPIVMAHGLGVAAESLRFLGRELVDLGYRAFAPDLPGFGRSVVDKPPRPLRVPQLADALEAWMRTARVKRAAIYGNSIGAQIAADLAARHPELAPAVILVGPTTDPEVRSVFGQVWRWLQNIPRDRSAAGGNMVRAYRRAGVRRVLRSFQHAVHDRIEEKLPRIDVPALVVAGSVDPITPLHWAKRVNELLPDGRMVVLEGAGHSMHGLRPRELAQHMSEFLESVAS
jgi:pimeloyl-ACP methyl ester carboxylesterase